ncbi:hypothetical protein GCM10020001_082490 [Nonomuraea salmonea]
MRAWQGWGRRGDVSSSEAPVVSPEAPAAVVPFAGVPGLAFAGPDVGAPGLPEAESALRAKGGGRK